MKKIILVTVIVTTGLLLFILNQARDSLSAEMKIAQDTILYEIDNEPGIGESYLVRSGVNEYYHFSGKSDLVIFRKIVLNSSQMEEVVHVEVPYRFIVIGELEIPFVPPFLIMKIESETRSAVLLRIDDKDKKVFLELIESISEKEKEN